MLSLVPQHQYTVKELEKIMAEASKVFNKAKPDDVCPLVFRKALLNDKKLRAKIKGYDKIEKLFEVEGVIFKKFEKIILWALHRYVRKFDIDFINNEVFLKCMHNYNGMCNFTTYFSNSLKNELKRDRKTKGVIRVGTCKFVNQFKELSEKCPELSQDQAIEKLQLSPKKKERLMSILNVSASSIATSTDSTYQTKDKDNDRHDRFVSLSFQEYKEREIENREDVDADKKKLLMQIAKEIELSKLERTALTFYLKNDPAWATKASKCCVNPKTKKNYTGMAVRLALTRALDRIRANYLTLTNEDSSLQKAA